MVSIRLTEAQYVYLESVRMKLKETHGFQVTRASVMLKLMELGKEPFEKHFAQNLKGPKPQSA